MKKRIILLCTVLGVAFLLRAFVFQSYRSTTDYMEDTISVGDYFLINKFVFGRALPFTDTRLFALRSPRHGDVIVFEYPEDPAREFVMRVVGIPGDVVEGRDKDVYVNGTLFRDTRVSHREPEVVPREQNPRDNFGPVTVPAHSLFVMGDNRDRSYDSRFWGCVPSGRIKGVAFVKYWSWDGEHRQVRWSSIGKAVH